MATLIIEDGSGIAGANTYQSLVDARAVAEMYGKELPPDDDAATTALILGAQYLEKYRAEYQGKKLTGTQGLQWPRDPVVVDGYPVDKNTIPELLKRAQVFMSAEAGLGVELQPTTDGKEVQKERVEGAVEVQYFQSTLNGGGENQPYFAESMALLEPLFKSALSDSGGGSGGWLFGARS